MFTKYGFHDVKKVDAYLDHSSLISSWNVFGHVWLMPPPPLETTAKNIETVALVQQWGDIYYSEMKQWLIENDLEVDPYATISLARYNYLGLNDRRFSCMWESEPGAVVYLNTGGDLGSKIFLCKSDEDLRFDAACKQVFVAVPKLQ